MAMRIEPVRAAMDSLLECAGVFKCDAPGRRALHRFLPAVNEE